MQLKELFFPTHPNIKELAFQGQDEGQCGLTNTRRNSG